MPAETVATTNAHRDRDDNQQPTTTNNNDQQPMTTTNNQRQQLTAGGGNQQPAAVADNLYDDQGGKRLEKILNEVCVLTILQATASQVYVTIRFQFSVILQLLLQTAYQRLSSNPHANRCTLPLRILSWYIHRISPYLLNQSLSPLPRSMPSHQCGRQLQIW